MSAEHIAESVETGAPVDRTPVDTILAVPLPKSFITAFMDSTAAEGAENATKAVHQACGLAERAKGALDPEGQAAVSEALASRRQDATAARSSLGSQIAYLHGAWARAVEDQIRYAAALIIQAEQVSSAFRGDDEVRSTFTYTSPLGKTHSGEGSEPPSNAIIVGQAVRMRDRAYASARNQRTPPTR